MVKGLEGHIIGDFHDCSAWLVDKGKRGCVGSENQIFCDIALIFSGMSKIGTTAACRGVESFIKSIFYGW